MRLTKWTHACVRLDLEGGSVLLDPGVWSEPQALDGVDHVLITHEHADHVDVDRLVAVVESRPGLTVHAPESVATLLGAVTSAVHPVTPGDVLDLAGTSVRVVGGEHAEIVDGLPGVSNVGYVVAEQVYHPGDSFFVPQREDHEPVPVLLVPISGPWLKVGESVDFVRRASPGRTFAIHDALLNDLGAGLVDRWLTGTTQAEYQRLVPGTSVEL